MPPNNTTTTTEIMQTTVNQPLEIVTTVNNRRNHHRRNNRRSSHHSSRTNNYQIYTFNNNNNSNSNTTTTSSATNNTGTNQSSSHNLSGIRFLFSAASHHKKTERNLLSASCSIFCIAILAVSLIEIRWFYLNGGGCNVNYIGAAHFFSPGRLEYQIEMSKVTKSEIRIYTFILPNGLELRNCANREIMLIMRTIIAFVFLAVFSSCCGLMLDTFGCMRPGVRLLRRNAIFHIMTVVFCLIVNGFCFWLTEKMNDQQNETRTKKGKKIEVSFDVSYYLIVLAAGLSILATAFTLIRRYPSDEDEQLERLLEEYTGFEEPIHLERSLPAPIQQLINLNENTCSSSSPPPPTSLIAPLPPSTPPPSLHRQSNNLINEPPPPYHPDTLNNASLA